MSRRQPVHFLSHVFIFPPAFYLKLRREVITDTADLHRTRWRAAGAYFILIVGGLLSVICTGAILFQLAMGIS